jgi:hypothetical protein
MSDLTGLVAFSFLTVTGVFCFYYVTNMINDMGDQIVTGFIRDHPIPAKQRWIMLYSRWVSYVTGVVALSFFLAIGGLLIADHAVDADVKLLGRLAAFVWAIGSFTWLIQGSVMFFSYRSLLRQAEAG